MAGAVLAPRAGKRICVALTPARATPRRRTGWAVNRDTAETLPPVRVCTELCVDKDAAVAQGHPGSSAEAGLQSTCHCPWAFQRRALLPGPVHTARVPLVSCSECEVSEGGTLCINVGFGSR